MFDIIFSQISASLPALLKTTILVVGIFEGCSDFESNNVLNNVNQEIKEYVKNNSDFKGKMSEFSPVLKVDKVGLVLLAGLGKKDNWNEIESLKFGGLLYSKLNEIKAKESYVLIEGNAQNIANVSYGMFLKSFNFDKYLTKSKELRQPKVKKVTFLVNKNHEETSKNLFNELKYEGEAVFLSRSLVTEPANVLYPEAYAKVIDSQLTQLGVEVKILDEHDMKQKSMGAILGVSQGSKFSGRLVVMKWNGNPGSKDIIGVAGKGVTFDTGGVSLKPAKGMWDMKYDMAGSAAVVGLMQSLAKRNAKVNVVGVVGLVENAIGGNAQRPGDVVTSMSGQTIEVLNTDAEGRLVLADVLCYIQKEYSPKIIVDLATLTGAIVVALGSNQYGGLFSNDDELSKNLIKAGEETGEKLWRFPLSDAYNKMMDSSIADMQNIATGGDGADSITAAQFLQRFIEDNVKWAHLDIAGMAWSKEGTAVSAKGATGFGVRLLNRFISYYEN